MLFLHAPIPKMPTKTTIWRQPLIWFYFLPKKQNLHLKQPKLYVARIWVNQFLFEFVLSLEAFLNQLQNQFEVDALWVLQFQTLPLYDTDEFGSFGNRNQTGTVNDSRSTWNCDVHLNTRIGFLSIYQMLQEKPSNKSTSSLKFNETWWGSIKPTVKCTFKWDMCKYSNF